MRLLYALRHLFWPLLAVAVLVHSCSSRTDWQQSYDSGSPEARLRMDQQALEHARQWNREHNRPADDDNADLLDRVDNDTAAVLAGIKHHG